MSPDLFLLEAELEAHVAKFQILENLYSTSMSTVEEAPFWIAASIFWIWWPSPKPMFCSNSHNSLFVISSFVACWFSKVTFGAPS